MSLLRNGYKLVLLLFVLGKSLVSEQENEMEKDQRR